MFKSIWVKITLFFGVILGVLSVALKASQKKVNKLEQKIKVVEKKTEIRREQDKAHDEVAKNEPQRVEELKQDNSTDRADRLNRVLHDSDRP